jgi:polyisoprenoid-binding protein YceI
MSWIIDPSHAEISFSVRHMMITNVRGRFEKFNGMVDFNQQDPAASKVEVTIEANSLNTRDAQRDAHLRSPDFLDADQFPALTFSSTRIEILDESHGRIHGDLAIRGVSRPVVLDTILNGVAKSPWGQTSAGFSASTEINRKDWGLTWNVALETGGLLVGEKIAINIELELIQQVDSRQQAAA